MFSGRVSEKVTKELLITKDTITAVIQNYKDTKKITLKRNKNRRNIKEKN